MSDTMLFRPTEVHLQQGDWTKARTKLGWTARTTFKAFVREMVEADCRILG